MQTRGKNANGMGRGKTRNVVICPFCFSRIVPLLLTRFALPVDVLSLSQEKGKECSYYRQVLISSVSYKVLRTLTLGSTKGGGIIYQDDFMWTFVHFSSCSWGLHVLSFED